MGDLDNAATFEGGIELGVEPNSVALFTGTADPSTNNEVAPQGSLYLRTNGEVWRKTGPGDSQWTNLALAPPHKDTHKSGGSDAFTSADLLEAVVKRLRETSGPTDLTVAGITDGQFLKRSGSTIIGVSPGSVGPDRDFGNVAPTVGSQTTSKTYVDLPGSSLVTKASPAVVRDYFIVFSGSFSVAPSGKSVLARFVFNGVPDADSERELQASSANSPNTLALNHVGPLAPGTTVKIQWKVKGTGSPTAQIFFGTTSFFGTEVSA